MTVFLLSPYQPTGHCPNASMASPPLNRTNGYRERDIEQNKWIQEEGLEQNGQIQGERHLAEWTDTERETLSRMDRYRERDIEQELA